MGRSAAKSQALALHKLYHIHRERKTHKHRQICGIVPGLGGWQKFVHAFFRVIPIWGRKKNTQTKSPQKIPGQSRETFVYVFFSLKAVAVPGVFAGVLEESSGKITGKNFPNRQMLQILGFRAPGKANLPQTLGPHCLDLVPTFRAGCFSQNRQFQPSRVFLKVIPYPQNEGLAEIERHGKCPRRSHGHFHVMFALKISKPYN